MWREGDHCSVTRESRLGRLFGSAEHIAVERGLAEFRSGRPITITAAGEAALAMPVDGMDDARLAAFRRLCGPAVPYLVVTSKRGRALGVDAKAPLGLAIGGEESAAAIVALAADAGPERTLTVVPASSAALAAIELAKLAQLLPALVMADAPAAARPASEPSLITIAAHAVGEVRQAATASLTA